MINEQEIKQLFSRLQNIQSGTSIGGRAGSKIWFKLPQGQEQAICIKDVEPGACLGLKADDGQWYLTQASEVSREERSRHQIGYRRCEQKPKDSEGIITLLSVDLFGYFKPNIAEFYLTGTKNKKLKILEELNVAQGQYIRFDDSDGFIQNLGKGKSIVTSRKYEDTISYFGGEFNKRYQLQTISILNKKNLSQFTPNLYVWGARKPGNTVMFYMGNGIWQSTVDWGLGQIIKNSNQEVVGALQSKDDAGNLKHIIWLYDSNTVVQLDAVVSPDDSNTIIHDGIIETLPGTIFVEDINISSLNVLYNLRNKTITHQSWLPHGISNFTYTANRSGGYKYTETLSGELLGLHYGRQYITQEFNFTQVTTYEKETIVTGTTTIEGYNRKFTHSGTNNLFLKKADADGNMSSQLQLNTSGKFFVILNTNAFRVLFADDGVTQINLTTSTTTFSIRETNLPDYQGNYNLDLSTYVGENILFARIIDGLPYLIKGYISACSIEKNKFANNYTLTTTIVVTSMTKLPHQDTFDTYMLPFFSLILDNGCFWNYYLSTFDFFANEKEVEIPNVDWRSSSISGDLKVQWVFSYKTPLDRPRFMCDQTDPAIHLNPISRFMLTHPFYEKAVRVDSDVLLSTDNLIDKKIYRCSIDDYINSYAYPSGNVKKKKSITEWNIDGSGNVFYKRNFLVDHIIDFPYINSDGSFDSNGVSVNGHSYYKS
ncbi:hypothetical protein kac65v162_gp043 [Nodularia phage vB_NspS-kac65v162]|jgi:hypothetical protein|uniref:Uncharacterized protein n=3 Tax=Ravarandavirus kac65v151 TaxID=2845689 RepID=A0A482MH68_9CAUD|nr:hypothetical protein HWC12_gp043 [Nodularia phage vB_NspS-kac65v151]QBQ73075.1 hypothetical protein kac65v151_gp043 [Nodularia phage vB_NspS-kac65v151]QBQ73281.1 hypothetical protein kac65v161_gp043 [Nodularia phage vB_NspS-kac65v161]QBQ73487.1 hypothetical protein kac65v162_gp043 [Nodularia phage vB_NspS-kac65v162]